MPIGLGLTNQKGGCGKTVAAVNIATGLAKKGKKTCLVDFDFQGNASAGLGVKLAARKSKKLMSEGLLNDKPFEDVVIETKIPNLWVLAGDQELQRINTEKILDPGRNQLLKEWLDNKYANEFDYFIVDSHPSLCLLFQNMLTYVNYYIVPSFPEPDSFDGLPMMFKEVSKIQRRSNPTLNFLGLLITKCNKKNATHEKYVKKIRLFAREKAVKIIGEIPDSNAVTSASDSQIPLIDYKKHLPVSSAYLKVVEELLELLKIRRGRTPKTPEVTNEDVDALIDQGFESNQVEVFL